MAGNQKYHDKSRRRVLDVGNYRGHLFRPNPEILVRAKKGHNKRNTVARQGQNGPKSHPDNPEQSQQTTKGEPQVIHHATLLFSAFALFSSLPTGVLPTGGYRRYLALAVWRFKQSPLSLRVIAELSRKELFLPPD